MWTVKHIGLVFGPLCNCVVFVTASLCMCFYLQICVNSTSKQSSENSCYSTGKITKHTLFILERENYYKINDSIILTKQLRIWKHKIGICRTLVLYSYRLVVVSFSYGRPAYIADPDIIFTRRRSFAEYWKHFVARFNDIHASGCNTAGSVRIQIKFGALRVYCL